MTENGKKFRIQVVFHKKNYVQKRSIVWAHVRYYIKHLSVTKQAVMNHFPKISQFQKKNGWNFRCSEHINMIGILTFYFIAKHKLFFVKQFRDLC